MPPKMQRKPVDVTADVFGELASKHPLALEALEGCMEGLPLMKVKGKVTKHSAKYGRLCQLWCKYLQHKMKRGNPAAECYFNQVSIVVNPMTCGAKDMRILGHDTPAMPAWIMSSGTDTGQG
ncbi:unnamed protein product [Effrenium voratum]|uniref:Uncharacterized protein n=1 Tax=Effrenium voratum TaxID=2562239 RepID=A0AA36J3A3_9DINO|nr:unnamed protein product [Effrenium voratum]